MSRIFAVLKSNASYALQAQAASALAGLTGFIVLARILNQEAFGAYIFFLTAIMFCEMIKAGFVQTAFIKYAAGQSEKTQGELLGSSWRINLGMSFVLGLMLPVGLYMAPGQISEGVRLFLVYYPVYGVLVLPFNYALWTAQAQQQFGKIALLRWVYMFVYLATIGALIFNGAKSVETFVLAYSLVQGLVSLLSVLLGWANPLDVLKSKKEEVIRLWKFGRYHVFSYLGTNLLKSADVFVIGLYFTSPDLAVYGVALKLIECIEIPLRGFISIALPKMSSAHNSGELREVKAVYQHYAGVVSWIFVPVILCLFFFAEWLITVFAGPGYVDGAIVLRIFLIYGALITLDRFMGVALDALDKPKYNFYKVVAMAVTNVLGNIVAAVFIGELWAIAMVTVANVIVGIFVGQVLLNKSFRSSIGGVYSAGFKFLFQLSLNAWRRN